ncbi:MAG: hypothetical protein E4H33_02225 [Anaerolineales bacterium]|nr:MAG: hypothetical protein E4H33_02225 [Anaerolineales bacterium]
MTVKLLMTWDILPDKEQEYFEFVISDFLPEIKQLGISPVDAWYTMYGDQPQIMITAKTQSQASLNVVMASKEWQLLLENLSKYVENFSYKVISAQTGFQL